MPVTQKVKDQVAEIFSGNCSKQNVCPIKDIMASYGDKWSMFTVLLLGQHETLRFGDLRTGIPGISQRMLTVTLRSLENDGIVKRTIYAGVPPRVEYQLTTLGESLLRPLLHLAKWAEENVEDILRARNKKLKQ